MTIRSYVGYQYNRQLLRFIRIPSWISNRYVESVEMMRAAARTYERTNEGLQKKDVTERRTTTSTLCLSAFVTKFHI